MKNFVEQYHIFTLEHFLSYRFIQKLLIKENDKKREQKIKTHKKIKKKEFKQTKTMKNTLKYKLKKVNID